jgi:hypothetical protein
MGEYTRSDIEWQPSAGGGRELIRDYSAATLFLAAPRALTTTLIALSV